MKNIEIFTGPGCAHCADAKALLRQHNMPFKEHDISDPAVLKEFQSRLPRVRSIPQIFADDDYLGNGDDLRLKLS